MKSSILISPELSVPKDLVTQTLVSYGAKGMGKTNLIAVICEELAGNGQKFSYLDPIGAGYGLRFAADGKGKGLDIVVLGGKHGDIPIEPSAGSIVADFVVNERVNVVIDISRRADGCVWKKSEKIRFTADYFERLFERQGEKCHPMMQLVDEAARFIPQLIPQGSVDLPRCVGAIEQVVEEGRNFGIGIALITQRSARMNKSVSELAECMFAFRTIGPNSVSAITDWLGEHIAKDRHHEIVGKLRTLPRGSALVVSPGWLNFEGVVPIRLRTTFDSSATPTADRKLITAQPLEASALEKYKTQMAATIEKVKAEDPKELKKLLAAEKQKSAALARDLEREKNAKPLTAKLETTEIIPPKLPKLITEGQLTKFEKQLSNLGRMGDLLAANKDRLNALTEVGKNLLAQILDGQKAMTMLASAKPRPLPPMQTSVMRPAIKISLGVKPAPIIQPVGNIDLNAGQQTILAIVRMLKERGLTPSRDMIARWHDTPTKRGIHPTGGTYGQNLAVLRDLGLLNGCELTEEGLKFAAILPTGFEAAFAGLNAQCQEILKVCGEGEDLTRDTLAEKLGCHPTGGTYGQNLALLRTRGVITSKGPIKLTEAVVR